MSKSKVLQFERNDNKEKAREILKNGILDMSVERLVQITQFGLVGNINSMAGLYGTSHFFNRMNYVVATNNEETDVLEYSYTTDNDEDVIASTTICVSEIENISGCINADNPDNVLDINIAMTDGSEITINVIY